MNGKLLVAGIGNIFLGDDAFGVEVVQRLAQQQVPEGVVVRDFGIRSYDLAYALMEDWDLVILLDALPQGGRPGTVYTFEPELPLDSEMPATIDAHSMDPVAVLQLVGSLGGRVGRMLVVGCEPATLEPDEDGDIGLSAPVASAVDEAIQVIQGLITNERSRAEAA
ncbi:MAG: hydrogenase maturation protease [Acidobacteria bacterium]|nr:hydrogenase maturation protease [Acidobacteriota bacterium]